MGTSVKTALQSFAPSFSGIIQSFSRWAKIWTSETEILRREGLTFIGKDPKVCGRQEVKKQVKVCGRVEERFVRRSARINPNLFLTQG
jgi:hypothetical protein